MQEHKTPDFNDYRSMMKTVRTPERVRVETLRAAERAEAQHASERAERAYGTHRRPARKRATWKPLAAAACVAAVVGLGALGVTFGLPLLGNQPVTSPDTAASAPSGNFFALAAYAAENPEGEPGKTVAINMDRFQPGSPAGRYNPITREDMPDGTALYAFLFDVTCTGENIASITYEIVGDGAYFEWYDEEEFLRAHGVYGDDDPAVKNGYTINNTSTFTVAYESQDLQENRINCKLVVPYTQRSETIALSDQLLALEGDEYMNLVSSYQAAEAADASEGLQNLKIKVSATYNDGTTQTKYYVIAPVDDLEDAYRTYLDSTFATYQEQGSTEGIETPALFTITEVEAA